MRYPHICGTVDAVQRQPTLIPLSTGIGCPDFLRSFEDTEVDREVMKMLRNEEKKLRRSYDPSGSSASGDEEETQPSTILSLDAVPEDDVKSSGWLADKEDFTDGVLTKLVIQDFRATLNSIHLAIFDQCLLGDKTIRAFAEEYGLRKSTVWDIANALRKNFKKFL